MSTSTVTSAVSVNGPFDKPQYQKSLKTAIHRDPIDIRFSRWVAKNPDLINFLLKFALEAKQAGFNRFGIAAIVERARWEANFASRGDEPFKISNDFRSHLARLLMQMDSTLEGFFELRELRSVAKASSEPSESNQLIEPADITIPSTERKEETKCLDLQMKR